MLVPPDPGLSAFSTNARPPPVKEAAEVMAVPKDAMRLQS